MVDNCFLILHVRYLCGNKRRQFTKMSEPGGFHIGRAGSPPEQCSVSSSTGKQVKFQLGHIALAFLYHESLYMSQAGFCQDLIVKGLYCERVIIFD